MGTPRQAINSENRSSISRSLQISVCAESPSDSSFEHQRWVNYDLSIFNVFRFRHAILSNKVARINSHYNALIFQRFLFCRFNEICRLRAFTPLNQIPNECVGKRERMRRWQRMNDKCSNVLMCTYSILRTG